MEPAIRSMKSQIPATLAVVEREGVLFRRPALAHCHERSGEMVVEWFRCFFKLKFAFEMSG